jgi:hypothetical protein
VIREDIHETADKAQIESVQAFEGRYLNSPDTFEIEEFRGRSFQRIQNYYLWNVFSTHKGKVDHQKWGQCSVQIDFLTDKKAEISLIYEDSIIHSRKIRGKFEDGYFYKRPAFVIVPLFPLAFGYNTGRYRLGLSEGTNLIIEESWNVWAFAFIAGSDTKAQTYAKFIRQ